MTPIDYPRPPNHKSTQYHHFSQRNNRTSSSDPNGTRPRAGFTHPELTLNEAAAKQMTAANNKENLSQTGQFYPTQPGSMMVIGGAPAGVTKISIKRTFLLDKLVADIGIFEGM
jgi:hypothetical protein